MTEETFGFNLFPERRDESYNKRFFSRLWYGDTRHSTDRIRCERNVFKNVKNSPLVKLMMQALKSSGCPIDFRRNIACEVCDKNVTGGFDPEMNQIVVCENMCKSERMIQGVLTHEMIHMFDSCVNHLDFKNLEHLACTEIRAANLTHCSFLSAVTHGNASFLRIRKQHEECVKHKAIYSILAVRRIPLEEAISVVDKVFERCYNDLEPIGRRIRRNSLDMYQAVEDAKTYYT